MPVTLSSLAARVGGTVVGDGSRTIAAIKTLEEAGQDDLAVYHNRRYLAQARESLAGALLVSDPAPFPGRDLLVCTEPYLALARLLEVFHPPRRAQAGVHPTAVVGAGARLGDGVALGPHAVVGASAVLGAGVQVGAGTVVGAGAVVGDDTVLHPHVVIEDGCRVGARCVLHAGVVVGSDGFGFATSGGVHHKVPQVGTVVIEDDVELGANVCVDRGSLGETRVGQGTKVDNLVQIGHNVQVGEHCLLVALSGIAGSTRLGHHVVMAGQSGAVGHVTIGDGVVVTAKTGVTEDTPPGAMVSGFPARPHREWLRAMGHLFSLEDLRRRLVALERTVRSLGERHD